ncbi:MAG: 3'-5' exonuclease PolB [Ignavibacteria bacterium]|nr:MAG: 3'-5' exonuclease PolB [Ignavibacteria bacterium]KAF0161526.1 MAG: 3'-5' exonuclease PolB [Ignavibacteria bacterium]
MNLVFDIETVGCEFESLPETQQEFLLRYAEQETESAKRETLIENAKRCLSLYPFTAKIVCLAMMNTDTNKTLVLFENREQESWESEEESVIYQSAAEEEIISKFWKYSSKAEKLISFNGRGFDLPFIMMRSAMLKIKPTRNFMKNRYDSATHIDLLEQFTFYGLTKKFNLDFYCHAFEVESPKESGITGMEVKELYKAGRTKDIAIYCGRDVRATHQLYKIWNEFLNLK